MRLSPYLSSSMPSDMLYVCLWGWMEWPGRRKEILACLGVGRKSYTLRLPLRQGRLGNLKKKIASEQAIQAGAKAQEQRPGAFLRQEMEGTDRQYKGVGLGFRAWARAPLPRSFSFLLKREHHAFLQVVPHQEAAGALPPCAGCLAPTLASQRPPLQDRMHRCSRPLHCIVIYSAGKEGQAEQAHPRESSAGVARHEDGTIDGLMQGVDARS
jgi:hypothetical protein